jgi:hypothetical protein
MRPLTADYHPPPTEPRRRYMDVGDHKRFVSSWGGWSNSFGRESQFIDPIDAAAPALRHLTRSF